MKKKIYIALTLALIVLLLLFAGFFLHFKPLSDTKKMISSALESSYENFQEYSLDNGLSVFARENHNVPLVYIEIAFRTGAIHQTSENAGLFHLYEHMIFKGNSLYPSASQVQKALSDLGVASWNGSTSVDCVNYFFTIPSDQIEAGLAFWNAAIRSPLFDEKEFENEKKVVLSEIEGKLASPQTAYLNAYQTSMFPEKPWCVDSGGSVQSIKNAEISQLKEIQSRYYIPKNAALFIGGDIDTEKTKELVEKIFGTWSNFGNEKPAPVKQPSKNPLKEKKYFVIPLPSMSEQTASLSVMYRGPDADFELEDTYTADYILSFLNGKKGKTWRKEIAENKELGIPSWRYVGAGYGTDRASGILSYSATMLNPEDNIAERSVKFASGLEESLKKFMTKKSQYSLFSKKAIIRDQSDSYIAQTETPEDFLSTIRFWWIETGDPEYYRNYMTNLSKVKAEDGKKFYEDYIHGKNPAVFLCINTKIFEENRKSFEEAGFEEVTKESPLWWQKDEWSFTKSEKKEIKDFGKDGEIYRAYVSKSEEKKDTSFSRNIKKMELDNGIPFYVYQTECGKHSALYATFKGGTLRYDKNHSGLESSLFYMMKASSKKYSRDKRAVLLSDYNSSIGSMTKLSGSALSLYGMDRDFFKSLPVFLDGILNPSFDRESLEELSRNNEQTLQNLKKDPESQLFYEMSNIIYEDSLLDTRTSVLPSSIENINEENMKKLYKQILDPSSMFLVLVGEVDDKKVFDILNSSLGKLKVPSLDEEKSLNEKIDEMKDVKSVSEIPEIHLNNNRIVFENEISDGTGYVVRAFKGPTAFSSEMAEAKIASSIYQTIMFNVVREKYGICYSPASYVSVSPAGLAFDQLYRVSDFSNFVNAMNEAKSVFLDGKFIQGMNSDGTYILEDIEDCLQGQINSYINSTYSSSLVSSDIASTLSYNLLMFDDIDFDSDELKRISSLSADKVLSVFRKYWNGKEESWFAVCGSDDAEKVRKTFSF